MTDNISGTPHIGYQCFECGRKFSAPQALRIHSRVHDVKELFECLDCGKTFKMQFYYKYHRMHDKGEYSLECGVCGKMFSNGSCLETHYKIHADDKFYKCKKCGKIYNQLGSFKNHLLGHPQIFYCNECGKMCPDSRNLEKHVMTHKVKKPFVCTGCGKRFAHMFNLEIHITLCDSPDPQVGSLKPPRSLSSGVASPGRNSNSQEHCKEIEVIDLVEESDMDSDLFLPLEVCLNEGDEVLSLHDSRDRFEDDL